ncbi:CDP-diacylglycerol--glycerol-3-phosphate 3-phosphatidyltransferase [Lujinxingia litoralis]|uniref:CDP-diacylglycerol--glycerol-3-phosphate 3-phosphatidyltransferase n=1 Tax=Lujinxingia litoralis TaxID=2211119 RepID=A0A328C8S5_9DELT|nr:CDP-diacylglycerol--glycerol-3-phosphate 3-phosphatidyltransferase [Lujinxingia litoralis]RAL23746.1 CDP-diacylglycerol--glycerol-3-phosphate 3-phosphatidyltransferase [Lujinxingia litoralis]
MSASTIRQDIVNIPNVLTLIRIALIPVVAMFIAFGDPLSCLIAVILFGVASFTDWVDGYLARKLNLVSMTGKFLDPLADKLLVMTALVMLIPLGRLPAWIVIIIVAREISISSLRSLAAGEGLIIAAGEGGKLKTAFQMLGLVFLITHYTYEIDYGLATLTLNFHRIGFWLLAISVFFSLWSAWEYFWGFLKAIGARGEDNADATA